MLRETANNGRAEMGCNDGRRDRTPDISFDRSPARSTQTDIGPVP